MIKCYQRHSEVWKQYIATPKHRFTENISSHLFLTGLYESINTVVPCHEHTSRKDKHRRKPSKRIHEDNSRQVYTAVAVACFPRVSNGKEETKLKKPKFFIKFMDVRTLISNGHVKFWTCNRQTKRVDGLFWAFVTGTMLPCAYEVLYCAQC